jgi:hypothetical protein
MWFAYGYWVWLLVSTIPRCSSGGEVHAANFAAPGVLLGLVIHIICHLLSRKKKVGDSSNTIDPPTPKEIEQQGPLIKQEEKVNYDIPAIKRRKLER